MELGPMLQHVLVAPVGWIFCVRTACIVAVCVCVCGEGGVQSVFYWKYTNYIECRVFFMVIVTIHIIQGGNGKGRMGEKAKINNVADARTRTLHLGAVTS